MSLPRLPFLYPHLFNPLKPLEWQPIQRLVRPRHSHAASFHSSSMRRLETHVQRYGSAAEPSIPPPPSKAKGVEAGGVPTTPDVKAKKSANVAPAEAGTTPENDGPKPEALAVAAAGSSPKPRVEAVPEQAAEQSLEGILLMEPATSAEAATHKPPHLHAPPYVHHFDTYSLVKDLERGGFSGKQAVTIMKAVRGLLATNLDLAKDGLVSKSDVENRSYLFRAASSELRTEIQNSRTKASEKMRTERAHLQHEADILNQKVTQETLTLKDDLRAMFNDRKMEVRMEQRGKESAIQELNYQITVALNSDSKGEVEGLRWFLTRRAAMFIASMALLILGSLRYSSYMIHMQAQERQRMEQSAKPPRTGGGGGSGGAGATFTVPSRAAGTQTEGGDTAAVLASMEGGSSPNYVSLG